MEETKSEIEARIDELSKIKEEFLSSKLSSHIEETIEKRLNELRDMKESADEGIFQSVLRSHKALCAAKQMGEKAAYGQDPAIYYTLSVCGEAGEMGNKIVKALRNGNDSEATKAAVISELPDVIIYSAVLAHVLDLNLTQLVNEKVQVVIERALSGYYGGPLKEKTEPTSSLEK